MTDRQFEIWQSWQEENTHYSRKILEELQLLNIHLRELRDAEIKRFEKNMKGENK